MPRAESVKVLIQKKVSVLLCRAAGRTLGAVAEVGRSARRDPLLKMNKVDRYEEVTRHALCSACFQRNKLEDMGRRMLDSRNHKKCGTNPGAASL
jgi:hypothetical protein